MITITDEGEVSLGHVTYPDLVAQMGMLYAAFLKVSEDAGIPWGNAKQSFEKAMDIVEEQHVKAKHAEILKSWGVVGEDDDISSPFTDDNE